jgi:putative ATP-dependent endonuclease of OLD family
MHNQNIKCWGGLISMFLSQLNIWNFRKYGTIQNAENKEEPGLSLNLNPRLNVLVGENDAGKSALIDAVKIVLNTHSIDFPRPELEDFFLEHGKSESSRALEFKIECIFRGFTKEEAKNFLEWLSFEGQGEDTNYYLKLTFAAKRDSKSIFYDLRAGDLEDGLSIDSKARELLNTTYLKPLRDSVKELSSRRNSRLSQILYNHDVFADEENHELIKIISDANDAISKYFDGKNLEDGDLNDLGGKGLLDELNTYLENFSRKGNLLTSFFSIADTKLKAILEKLSLELLRNKAGLGSQNLLFIATELLLLKRENFTGLKLALVEEIEAHLHPQSQILLIEFLEELCNSSKIQMFVTTHSPNLASKVNLKNLLIAKNNRVFNMGDEYTKLRVGDYLYLQRFLDVTQSNLFFANGVIMVEGDAENILIPTIAKIIDVPLSKYGVSVINVGSVAFLRYSNIFIRKSDRERMGVPVSVITDLDVKPSINGEKYILNEAEISFEEARKHHKGRKEMLYTNQDVKCFVSDSWTLEYCIAKSEFQEDFFRAVKYAEYIKNSEDYGLTDEKVLKGDEFVNKKLTEFREQQKTNEDIAYYIYNEYLLEKKISKAIVAQCFANILINQNKEVIKEKLSTDINLVYLVNAIKYAANKGGSQ